jgi:hypothetical protein
MHLKDRPEIFERALGEQRTTAGGDSCNDFRGPRGGPELGEQGGPRDGRIMEDLPDLSEELGSIAVLQSAPCGAERSQDGLASLSLSQHPGENLRKDLRARGDGSKGTAEHP